jgi:hypothetical protein
MFRIAIVILIYHRHKPSDLIVILHLTALLVTQAMWIPVVGCAVKSKLNRMRKEEVAACLDLLSTIYLEELRETQKRLSQNIQGRYFGHRSTKYESETPISCPRQ